MSRDQVQIKMASGPTGAQTPIAYIEWHFTNARKQALACRKYLPQLTDASSIAIFHHGLGDHVGRYEAFFLRLAASGVGVYTYDAFGHGLSEPKDDKHRVYIDNFNYLVDDLVAFIAHVKGELQGSGKPVPPVYGVSQSLGSLVTCYAATKVPLDGIVLHSALIDVEWTPTLRMQAPMGGLLAVMCPYARIVPAVRPEDLSQDKQVVQAYQDDPLTYSGNTKARTANEILKGMNGFHKLHKQLTCPIYACHGTKDRTTSLKAVKDLLAKVPSTDKTFREVPGGYHELLLGPEKEEATQHVVDWILSHAKPQAGGSASAATPGSAPAAAPATGSNTPGAVDSAHAAPAAVATNTGAGTTTGAPPTAAGGDVKLVAK